MAWPLGRRAADTGAQAEAQPETISCKAKVAITNTDLDAERAPGGLIKCPVQQAESCRHDDGPGSHATSAMTNGSMQMCPLCSWGCKAGQAGSQNYACTAPGLLFLCTRLAALRLRWGDDQADSLDFRHSHLCAPAKQGMTS